ncbi:hypothetical protein U0070_015849 [Myodes glareolus]|uniref:G-protein coupled receptors family 1 profile domain-containing protein n=1 Tax=Myodes glareolus TaxID=447135 RepID=A0AAW0J4D7_MYOGA
MPVERAGGHVDDHGWPVVEADYRQVRGARGQCFPPALWRIHSEHSEEDEQGQILREFQASVLIIGCPLVVRGGIPDFQAWKWLLSDDAVDERIEHGGHYGAQHSSYLVLVRPLPKLVIGTEAREPYREGDTESEWKGHGDRGEHEAIQGSQEPADRHQEETRPAVHEDRITEWMADGHIAVLSLMDMMYISVTVPKMLMDQVLGSHRISAAACGMQMFLYTILASSEFFILALMSYDRYVAICHPLRYPVLMNRRACLHLMSVCWFLGSLDGFIFTPITMMSPFCGSREIHHFFCEVPAVIKLSCSGTWLYETLIAVVIWKYTCTQKHKSTYS